MKNKAAALKVQAETIAKFPKYSINCYGGGYQVEDQHGDRIFTLYYSSVPFTEHEITLAIKMYEILLNNCYDETAFIEPIKTIEHEYSNDTCSNGHLMYHVNGRPYVVEFGFENDPGLPLRHYTYQRSLRINK